MSGRILVVDDDRSMVRTLCDILTLRGWDPVPAYSGEEAVRAACSEGFDTVLMDVRMPGIDGVTAFKQMKDCPPPKRVVLMTAHSAPELLDEARREGAAQILSKPIDISALLAVLG